MKNVNPEIVGLCTPGAWLAVQRAMERLHETNPAGYHAARPSMKKCPFPPKLIGTREPTDAELAAALEAGDTLTEVPIHERCPFVRS
jgi:hypothetical protein